MEEVSEGFMQLVESCGNGAAVIVFKGAPPMVYHDVTYPVCLAMAAAATGLSKVGRQGRTDGRIVMGSC